MTRCGASTGAVLVGFMGSGKSSVGKALAFLLGAEFVDLDDRIEASAGESIRDIFDKRGERAFREMESAAIREVASVPGRVVATGGGAFLDQRNRDILKSYAPVFFLDVSPDVVLERLSGDRSRPLFPGNDRKGKVLELMEERRPYYEQADYRIPAGTRSAPEVAGEILQILMRREGPTR